MRKIAFGLWLAFVACAWAQPALVNHGAVSGNALSITTSGIDMVTGGPAKLLVACSGIGAWNATQTASDSCGNTWTSQAVGVGAGQGWAFYAPVTGTGCGGAGVSTSQTFTVTNGSSSTSSLEVAGFKGVTTISALDQTVAGGYAYSDTYTPANLTPGQSGELVVSCMNASRGAAYWPYTVSSPWMLQDQVPDASSVTGSSLAWLVDATTAAVAPTWTGQSGGSPLTIAMQWSFKAASTSAALAVSPSTIPASHSGNISLLLTCSGCAAWNSGANTPSISISGVTGASKVSQTILTSSTATLVVTTGSGTGTLTVSDGTESGTTTVATAALSVSPVSGGTYTTPTVTLTGTDTLWHSETLSGLFSVSGGTGASIGTPTLGGGGTSDTSATATVTVGTAQGTLTVTDNSTGKTANFTASADSSGIAYDNSATCFNNQSSSPQTCTYTVGTSASGNSLLLVTTAQYNGSAATSATFDGYPMTVVGTAAAGINEYTTLLYLVVPSGATGSSHTLSVSLTGQTSAVIESFTGVSATPIVQYTTPSGSRPGPLSITTTGANNWIACGCTAQFGYTLGVTTQGTFRVGTGAADDAAAIDYGPVATPGATYIGIGSGGGTVQGVVVEIATAVASVWISPTSAAINTTPTVTFTGLNTSWSSGSESGLFTVSGGTGASISGISVTSTAAATATLATGSTAATLTITDTSTGATAAFTSTNPPAISGVSIVANSANSVYATWSTTGPPSSSQVICGPLSSAVVNPYAVGYGVTSHAMASDPMPNASGLSCYVKSCNTGGCADTSTSPVTGINLPAPAPSSPIVMLNTKPVRTRLSDRYAGQFGAPTTGQFVFTDNTYGFWASDGNSYYAVQNWGLGAWPTVPTFDSVHGESQFVTFTDSQLTNGSLTAGGWQQGTNNSWFNSCATYWYMYGGISINGNSYVPTVNIVPSTCSPGGSTDYLAKSTDHLKSTINPQHNTGRNVSNITAMSSCSGGTVTATTALNITDTMGAGFITSPASVAIIVENATGTAVNGGPWAVSGATSTSITYSMGGSCPSGWSYTSGGTINQYGWDTPVSMTGISGIGWPGFIYGDADDYQNGTPVNGQDSMLYYLRWTTDGHTNLWRLRMEDLETQTFPSAACFSGPQTPPAGFVAANWGGTCTHMDPGLLDNAMGVGHVAYGQYLTALNRYVFAFQIGNQNQSDSNGAGSLILEDQCPWCLLRPLGIIPRIIDTYYFNPSGPEFPEWIASSQTSANGIVSINLGDSGGDFNGDYVPTNSYDMYWTQGLEFAAAPSLSVAQSGLVPGEIITGLDIAYNFSPSDMAGKSTPNLAPADAAQQWAIPNAGPFLSTFNDSYGSYWFSITNASGSGGLPSGNFSSSQYITTTYKQPLTAFTVSDCFGHYPSALLNNPSSGAIALQWGGNLTISWVSTSNGNTTWDVNVLGTDIGHVNIPDNSLGCIVVRRNSQNLVQVYTSAGIGASLPLTVAQSATVTGTFSTSSALEFGDASNSFWGIQSSARVWHLDVPDDGLVQQFAALRPAMWNRGPGAAIAMGPSGSSSSLAVSVAGVTNTQAVLSYTASDSSPCTVTVSENSSLSPPVNDVNSSLFSGSNLDNRTGSIANGLARKFVTGLRAVQQGTDGNWYSRSLQAYTTHYLQVACDTAIGTGSFTTANIPTNVGYRDPQPVNPSTGQKILPTLTASRSQIIKDPFTGAKVARVTLPADFVGGHNGSGDAGGGNLGDGAYPLCGPSTGPGPGYICTLMSGDGGYAQMYYIVPSTGAVTYLGIPRIAAEGGLGFSWATYTDPIYGYLYVQGVSGFYQAWYSGDYSAASPGAYATMSYNTLFTGTTFAAMVHAFNPAFDPTYFTCGNSRANGDYITVGCGRNGQDSYGWGAVYSVSSNAIVAAGAPHLNSTTSWCALHNQDGIYNLAMQELSLHGFSGNGTVLGQGPYTTTLSGDINASVTSIGISGEPECSGCGSDPALPVAAVGDWFTFPSGEIVRIVTKTSSTAWVVTRGANGTTAAPQSSGAVMTATCAPSTPWLSFWQFTEDPDMADTTNAYYTYDDAYWTQTGGHASFGATFEAGEGYNGYIVRPGSGTASPITQVNQPIANVGAQSTFAGAFNYCFGETCKEYPYVGPTGTTWLTDDHSFAGTGDGSWTNKAGNLYVFTPNVNYSYYLYTPKYQSIETVTGQAWAIGTTYYYTNISGPGSAIGTTTAYNQQVCQAYLAGECYAGSTPGQIYFNTSQALTAGGECGSGVDFCALNYGWWANALIQIGQNNVGRVLTYGLNTFREPMDYTISSTLPDGSWTLFVTGDNKSIARGDAPSHVLMVKQTPFTPPDAVDRTKFVPVTMSLTAHGTGAVAAAVKFGYAEYGAPSAYHCSQYADICVANTNAAPPADGTTAPFQYATSDTWTGISCASTCSITIPVLPGHLAYAQAEYLNSSGAVVATDAPVLIGDNM